MNVWHLAMLAVAGTANLQAATITYFPAANDPQLQGFVRVINHSDQNGAVSIRATDDAGMTYDAISLAIDAGQTVHFNSDDLEMGNPAKRLSAGLGAGQGDWRLDLSSDLNVEALAYIRTTDGFLTAMSETVPGIGNRHRVPVFNPGSNVDQVSRLRLVNPGDEAAAVAVLGIDDNGIRSHATLMVPARGALSATAADLEAGGLGDGRGKWQLIVTSDRPLVVVSLLATPTGHVTNLSYAPRLVWRGLDVEPESRCAGHRYDRDEYGTRYRSKEDDLVEELGAVFGPYTGRCFGSTSETDIEHMVALHEAHFSGMCFADRETKRTFAGDILNLTLAAPAINRAKSSLDAFDWMPEHNSCWFARRVVDVKLKYGMTVDREEAHALELVLAACATNDIVRPECAP